MNEHRNNLTKVQNKKTYEGEVVNNNILKKDLNRYEQHTSNEYLMINESLNRHINLQEVTLSRINQIRDNNDAIRYNLAINDFEKSRFFEDVNYLHRNSIRYLQEKNIEIWNEFFD